MDWVMYLDIQRAHEEQRYFPMNVLSGNYDAHAAASVVLEGFKRIWPELQDGSAVNIDSFVYLGAYMLAEHKLPFIPYFTRFYSKPDMFTVLAEGVKDWHVKEQFETMKLAPRKATDGTIKMPDIVDTSIKRVNRLAASPLVRYPLAQRGNLLDVEQLLKTGRSVLLNLALADQNAKALLGALFTQHFEQTAKRYRPAEGAPPYVLIIDEVEEFVFQSGKALESMFAEARKAGVAVWVAHQYGAQLSDELNAALSQCATKVTFKTGYEDALVNVRNMGFPYDPYRVKERTGNPYSVNGQRTVYFSEAEQMILHARAIMELGPQEAFVQLPDGSIRKLVTLDIAGDVDTQRLAQLERAYIQKYFQPEGEIIHDIETMTDELAQKPATSVPVRPITPSSTTSANTTPPRKAPPQKPTKPPLNPPPVVTGDKLELPENEDDLC